jgi:TnpA family transposase
MLQRDGHPTALGEAIAMYGRIFKTLHILSYIDTDETYRRDIKGIRNLQEGRHALARKICHGKKGELYHRYERGLENQLGSLGLVLNTWGRDGARRRPPPARVSGSPGKSRRTVSQKR